MEDGQLLKLNVGAGGTLYMGWTSYEYKDLDITNEQQWEQLFKNKKISNILMEHVAEHLFYDDFIKFMNIVQPYLGKGAVIRVAVPDGNHPSEYVRELTGVNGTEPGADDHKYFYTIQDMKNIAKICNYKLKEVEYFSQEGVFMSNNLSFENGYISRCSKNYKGRFTTSEIEFQKMIESVPEHLRKQFFDNKISYISLLVDFMYE